MSDMKRLSLFEIQEESTRILRVVHAFCESNNIRYSLAGGSLIGAVRHGGFIPWDDDIDIIMPRADFNRFCQLFKNDELSVMKPGDKDYWLKFARVFDNTRTIVMDHTVPFTRKHTGLWIDVFPIDVVPSDRGEFEALAQRCCDFKKYSWVYRHLIFDLRGLWKFRVKSLRPALQHLKFVMMYNCDVQDFSSLDNKLKKEADYLTGLQSLDSEFCGGLCFAFRDYFKRYNREWFEEYIKIKFGSDEFCAIKEYDKYLSIQYGDYMTIPPVEKQKAHTTFKVYWKESISLSNK